jgi:hypothetical protein
MSRGLFLAILGAGGEILDPGGQNMIVAKARQRDLTCADPYQYTATQAIAEAVRAFKKDNPSLPVIMEGDSCGANVLAYLIAALAPIQIDYAGFIQASMYCNFNYPPIKPNCGIARIFYSDFAHTGGLGTFVPQPESVPAKPIIRNGWHVVNGGKTLYRADYIPAAHPDDQDVANVQNPMFADIDGILTVAA